jgi:hypothetical protein
VFVGNVWPTEETIGNTERSHGMITSPSPLVARQKQATGTAVNMVTESCCPISTTEWSPEPTSTECPEPASETEDCTCDCDEEDEIEEATTSCAGCSDIEVS